MKSLRVLAVVGCALAPFALAATKSDAAPSSSWARGVDVSDHDGTINWNRAAAAGLSFAIARVSDGTQHPDTQFQRNWANIKAAGLVRGVYQYFRPSESATAQANLLLNAVGSFQPGDIPPILDLETTSGMSSSYVASQVNAWVAHVKAQTGLDPIIYCAPGWWNGLSNHPSTSGVDLWVANWGVSSPRLPSGWSNWTFWQYSSSSSVISGADSNYFHGTPADLNAWVAAHGVGGSGGGSTGGGSTGGGSTGGGSTGGGSTSHPTVRQGDSGQAVQDLQTDLGNKGYPVTVDGIFGPKTRAAVVAFQNANGLTPDGIVGPLTWAALTS